MDLSSEPGRGSRFSFRIPVGVPRVELPPVTPAADLGAIVIGMHPIIRSAVCDTISIESTHVISVDSTIAAIEALQDFGPRIARIRIVIDSNAAAKMEQAVSGLRAAAAPRQVEVIALHAARRRRDAAARREPRAREAAVHRRPRSPLRARSIPRRARASARCP